VLVDEYQDTNSLQYRITAALAGKHRNLCVCGDPDQSIYGWRGADLRNILDFERDFAPVTVVRLETNYRSKRNILDAAQAVIEHNTQRKAKKLLTESDTGEKLVSIQADDELDEARLLCGWIRELRSGRESRERGYRYRDMAIFYRANFLQRALERALREAAIPYKVAAGLEFFERREIKDLIAYLRVLVNPNDDVSFERILNVPSRGIGDATLEKLKIEAARMGLPLLAAAQSREARAALGARARNALETFLGLLDSLHPLADGPAEEALSRIIDATKYEEYCGNLGDGNDSDRVENVHELVISAAEYDAREPEGKTRGFLAEVSLVSDTDRLGGDADYVTLMTLHSAKGLEFPVVLMAGLEDGLIPHRRSVEERAGGEGVEEERRLFYVGLTRARERVFLSRARTRTQFGASGGAFVGETAPSRFLLEIPPDLVNGALGAGPDPRDEDWDREISQVHDDSDLAQGSAFGRFTPGELVRHQHFGVGKILELRGSGVNTRAVVSFRAAGEKQLLLQYAKLEKVSASS
jgi:DNA helicase-2/ATP-dependent DNA helicase PcrA